MDNFDQDRAKKCLAELLRVTDSMKQITDAPSDGDRLSLTQVSERVGVSTRTLRSWIQLCLLQTSLGATRAGFYSQEHVKRAQMIQKFLQQGWKLNELAELQETEPSHVSKRWSRPVKFPITDKVSIVCEPGRSGLEHRIIQAMLKGARSEMELQRQIYAEMVTRAPPKAAAKRSPKL